MNVKTEQNFLNRQFKDLPYHCSSDALYKGWIAFLEGKKLLNSKDVQEGFPTRKYLTKQLTKEDELALIAKFLPYYKQECENKYRDSVDWLGRKNMVANRDELSLIVTRQEFEIMLGAPLALVCLLDGDNVVSPNNNSDLLD